MARMRKKEEIIAGLDIGTSKVCVVVGEIDSDGDIDVIGLGTAPSKGVKKGVVVDIEQTIQAIEQALEEAEMMAGCSLHEVYVNISGGHIKGDNSSGVVALKEKEVRQADLQRVLEGARAIQLAPDREMLHQLPQEFLIDGQEGITKPLGMSGMRIEAKVHLITASATSIQNITKCVTHAGLHTPSLIFDALASSAAILSDDEKDLGVALIDIGAGTTDLAIHEGGRLVHTAVLPIGGDHITSDIAVGIRTPIQDAERIKIKYGCAKTNRVRQDEVLRVPGVAGRRPKEMSRMLLAEIIEPRVEEIFLLVQKELRDSGYEELLASGLVLTGGSTHMDGMIEFAEEVTGLPVRRGNPQGIGGLSDVVKSSIYATAIGLLLQGTKQQRDPMYNSMPTHNFHRRWRKIKGWLSEFF